MILPCPHCKRRFKLWTERIPAGTTRLKCPACKGQFVVDTSPLRRVPIRTSPPVPPATATAQVSSKSTREATEGPPPGIAPPVPASSEPPRKSPRRVHLRTPKPLWLFLPAFGLLVALIGILMPAIWRNPTVAVKNPEQAEQPASQVLQPPIGPGTSTQGPESQAVQSTQGEAKPLAQALGPPNYRSLWPFDPAGIERRCEVLAQLLDNAHREKASDPCRIYSPWIAYLTLEPSSEPSCGPERVFALATEAIAKRNLCGCGYAFLSAYYTHKRIPDRSRSFLEQSLQLSPADPWVKIVEAVVYEREFGDRTRSIRILKELLDKESSFEIARYHLARIYVAEEEYGKAREHFLHLGKVFPHQPGFVRIEKSLASIEQAPYYSADRARGMLEAGRAFSDLMEYPLAGQLCRKVVEDMSGTLPQAEQKSALYDLGRIAEITGDRETAYACYQKALRIDPFYRDARERIGNILKGGARTS